MKKLTIRRNSDLDRRQVSARAAAFAPRRSSYKLTSSRWSMIAQFSVAFQISGPFGENVTDQEYPIVSIWRPNAVNAPLGITAPGVAADGITTRPNW
jgi:hypothetical protein